MHGLGAFLAATVISAAALYQNARTRAVISDIQRSSDLVVQHRPREALAILERLNFPADWRPGNAHAARQIIMAEAYLQLDQFDAACACYQAALRLDRTADFPISESQIYRQLGVAWFGTFRATQRDEAL